MKVRAERGDGDPFEDPLGAVAGGAADGSVLVEVRGHEGGEANRDEREEVDAAGPVREGEVEVLDEREHCQHHER
jgi:hypothetical protein